MGGRSGPFVLTTVESTRPRNLMKSEGIRDKRTVLEQNGIAE